MSSKKIPIQLCDFVGEYGPYQFALTLLLFVRFVLLGLMANSGPLLTPDVTFYCKLPMDEVLAIMPNISLLNQRQRDQEIREEFKRICQLDLHLYHLQAFNWNGSKLDAYAQPAAKFNASAKTRECTEFTYDLEPDQGRTMTSEFDLVCDRDSLRSIFQSLLSAAIVVAHVFWGTFSDRYGRFKAQKLCLIVSALAGFGSIFATDFWSFAIARSLCTFGDLGLVVSLTTVVVELVGNRFRGLSVALVNFGYALGVTILPYIVAYFEDFRTIITFTLACHLISAPIILIASNESVLWLLTNRRFKQAKRELKRIASWNRNLTCLLGANANQANKTTASDHDYKRKLELEFENFIQQIESQNFCDPLGEPAKGSGQFETSSVLASSSTGGRDDDHLSEISISQPVGTCLQQSHEPLIGVPNESIVCAESYLSSIENGSTGGGDSHSSDHESTRAAGCGQSTHLNEGQQMFEVVSFQEPEERGQVEVKVEAGAELKEGGRMIEEAESAVAVISVTDQMQRRQSVSQRHPDCINLVAGQLSFVGRVNRLFRDKQLMIAVFTIVWTTFNSELQYTSYIIINLEAGEDVYLNYILGGCMEALAAITASLLLSYAPRRVSLIAFWLLISISCFGLSLAHIDSHWAVWLLALAKFSQSALSSIASVAAYESFPTFLRQSGSGLVFTLGMLGSVFAPLIFAEFDDQAGMDGVLMTFSFSSLTAAILIYFFLRETKNCELQ